MTLKAVYTNKDEIPELFVDYYVERDGKFELKVEGTAPMDKLTGVTRALESERQENKQLKSKLTSLTSVIGETPLETVAELLERKRQEEEEELIKAKNKTTTTTDDTIEARIRAALRPKETELQTIKEQYEETKRQVEQYAAQERARKLHETIHRAATKSKVIPTAVDDVINHAKLTGEVYVNDAGEVVTRDGFAIDEWVNILQEAKPHWWAASVGGNSRGAGGGSAPSVNPFMDEALSFQDAVNYKNQHGIEKARQMINQAKEAKKNVSRFQFLLS